MTDENKRFRELSSDGHVRFPSATPEMIALALTTEDPSTLSDYILAAGLNAAQIELEEQPTEKSFSTFKRLRDEAQRRVQPKPMMN